MTVKKKTNTKKKPAEKKKATSAGKTIKVKITKGQTRNASGLEVGVCFDMKGCKGTRVTAQKVTKQLCKTSGGKSWRGDQSGCKDL
jgi:hypothetical protein